jgi:phospholipase/carboxylesterase
MLEMSSDPNPASGIRKRVDRWFETPKSPDFRPGADTLYAMETSDSATTKDDAGGGGAHQTSDPAPQLETVELCTGDNPTAAIVWLHGLGADGHDFEPIVPFIRWSGAPAIRFVFPHAPVRPVTINGGMPMRAWYDILSLEGSREQDADGIESSVRGATRLIEREMERGIAPENIVVAGFSQGGAIATLAGMRFGRKLAGLVVLSSYLLFESSLAQSRDPANASLPVFVAHGTMDPMLPLSLGQEIVARVEAMGHEVEWHSYPIGHSVSPEEIEHLTAWLQQRLT